MGWLARVLTPKKPQDETETAVKAVKEIRARGREKCRALDAVLADLSALLREEQRDKDAKHS